MVKIKELEQLREQIDVLDNKILELFQQRFSLVKQAKEIKKQFKLPSFDQKREEEIISRLAKKYSSLNQGFIRELYQAFFDCSHRLFREKRNTVVMEELKKRPIIIAGPCSVESKEQIEKVSFFLNEKGVKLLRGGIFKPRTNSQTFQGLGLKGLAYSREAADQQGQYLVCEVLTPQQLEPVYDFVDIIQIGSRSMTSYEFLKEVGKKTAADQKPVLLKRGFSSTVNELVKASRYLTQYGNNNIIFCLRGIRTFEQIDSCFRNTPDLAAILELKEKTNKLVLFDPSHSSGQAKYVLALSKAALALGADGLMIEVHPEPKSALCDGKQSLNFSQFEQLLKEIKLSH